MRWLLDTCVLSELARDRPSAAVVDWLREHGASAVVSVVSIGEIQYGIERMSPGRARNALQHWFDDLSRQFAGDRTLAADEPVWRSYGRLKASLESIGRRQQDLDLLLAATASVTGLTLVTRNVRHFADTGINFLNPWP